MLTSLLLACAVAPAPLPPAGDTVTITLPLEAHIQGTEIELGEVASLEGDAELVARLEALELGYAPAPGYSRLLRMDQIRSTLLRRAPEVSVRFRGQHASRIWPQVEEVGAQAIEEAARTALLRFVGASAASLSPIGEIQGVKVPASAQGATLRARVEGTSGATTSVAVEVLVDSGIYRTLWTRWTAERWVDVPVLARDVAVGEVFTAAHFHTERRSVAGPVPAALSPDTLIGTSATRPLQAGSIVRQTDMRRSFAIRAGENLVLAVKKGAVEARVPAVALEAAAIGSRLRVRLAAGEQDLTARLVSADLAVVDLGQ